MSDTPPRGAVLETLTRRRAVGERAIVIGYAFDCRACGLETVYLLRSFGPLAQTAAASAVRRHNEETAHPEPPGADPTLPGMPA